MGPLLQRTWRAAVRLRYPLLALWAVPWFVVPLRRSLVGGMNDWLYLEYGARVLVHLDGHYAGGAVHLYADHPEVQVGPPALWLVAAAQWAPPRPVAVAFAVAMAAAGLVVVALAEATARRLAPDRLARTASVALAGGLLLVPAWCTGVARFRHLDDVLAVVAVLAATTLVAGGRRHAWWVAAALVGTAAAAKPWALAAAPLLWGLPRPRRAPAALVAVTAAAAWWLPFVLGDRGTVSALGGYHLYVDGRSALSLLGVLPGDLAPTWVRPVQLVGGFGLALLAAVRGRWTAAPLVGAAVRIGVDPQVWPYYGMAPVAFALLVDLTAGRRRLPAWTLVTVSLLYVTPELAPAATAASRLAFALLVVGFLVASPAGGRLPRLLRSPAQTPAAWWSRSQTSGSTAAPP